MFFRINAPPHAVSDGRYRSKGVSPLALTLSLSTLLALAILISTFRVSTNPFHPTARLIVQSFDLTPPPPPPAPDTPTPPAPVAAIHVPKPVVQTVQPPPQLTTTPDPSPPPTPPPATPVTTATTPAPAPAPPREVSGGNLSSSMIHAPPPRYPMESRRKREQGTVVLNLLLRTDGSVAELHILRSSGHSRLDEAARNAVRRWRWSPTVRDGASVQVKGTVEIPFILTS